MSKEDRSMKFVLILALVAGCSTKPNPKSCLDNHCSDPELPFCDVDGAIGGEPNTCIAVECSPNTFEECRGDRALTCNATGNNYDLVECEFGCGAGGCLPCNTTDCEKHIIPKYLPNVCNELAAGDPLTFSSQTIDTTNALSCHSVVPQANGPEICVFHRSAITIAANQTLRVIGTRAIAIVADRELKIDGVLDVSANVGEFGTSGAAAHGPGGGFVMSGGLGDTNDGSGSGGAGFKTPGGAGGKRGGSAANGGAMGTDPSFLSFLVGGTAPPRVNGIFSGFAGGAATIISCRSTVSVAGLIDAAGGGGGGGHYVNFTTHFPAGGGASGGNVVIQGMNVSITGQLFANGGGGGAGENSQELFESFGDPGQKGRRSSATAQGGPGLNGGGTGGTGGAGVLFGGSGGAPSIASGFGGAGGGSTGFLQTYTPQNVTPTITPTEASPALQGNQAIPTN
jgi:hypothetical protein